MLESPGGRLYASLKGARGILRTPLGLLMGVAALVLAGSWLLGGQDVTLQSLRGHLASVAEYQQQINAPDFFSKSSDETQAVLAALQASEEALESAFTRWDELEAMKQED